jgi:transposase InsO family protein
LRRITVTVPTTIDASVWLSKYLEGADGDTDLARAMLQAFAEAIMSAQASMQCGAGYGERSEDRENFRNGYRLRPWDTRAGTIELVTLPYIDWFNTTRLHTEIGDVPPAELEATYYRQQQEAGQAA